jgi:UDPglucose 6-dehydrogenase
MLGLAFKPHTSSIAGSASVALIRELTGQGAHVRAYDPFAMEDAERELQHTIKLCRTPYEAAEGVDVLVVGTGWPEFRTLDFAKMKELLRRPIIVDTKNLLDSERLRRMGYQYFGVGRA